MIRLDGLSVWKNSEVKERLSWYYKVMRNTKPAKFLIAKHISYEGDLKNSSSQDLWVAHRNLSSSFADTLNDIETGRLSLEDLKEPEQSFLDLKTKLLNRMLRRCEFCEWRCRVDRVESVKKGACKADAKSRISTWFHHYGEEAPLVSGRGSGTIFFTGCTFRCVFCQNWDISQNIYDGAVIDSRKLSLIMKNLREEGAANINFVGGDPTPNLHTIFEGISRLEINTPLLWNSNMYLTQEAMEILTDVIDIWLPDFKWGNDRCAIRLSKVPRYFEIVSRNHELAQQNGDMIIRHLVVPGHVDCCTQPILKWISANCPRALVNIMGQYHPDHLVPSDPRYSDIDRHPSHEEMSRAYRYAEQLGIVYQPVS